MQKVTSKRSVSKFAIIANSSTESRDTSQKCYVNTSFDTYNTTQNNKVSLVWRHLETLQRHLNIFWRHFRETLWRQQPSAKCLRTMSLDFAAIKNWRHFDCQRPLIRSTSRSINFEVSLSVSEKPKLSLRDVSEVSLNLVNFCEVSLESEALSWQF